MKSKLLQVGAFSGIATTYHYAEAVWAVCCLFHKPQKLVDLYRTGALPENRVSGLPDWFYGVSENADEVPRQMVLQLYPDGDEARELGTPFSMIENDDVTALDSCMISLDEEVTVETCLQRSDDKVPVYFDAVSSDEKVMIRVLPTNLDLCLKAPDGKVPQCTTLVFSENLLPTT